MNRAGHRPHPLWLALVAAPLLTVGAGLAFVLLPAFGYLPALGGTQVSLQPWRMLAESPGLGSALIASLLSAGLATPLALGLALLLAYRFAPDGGLARGAPRRAAALLSWILATPHAAFAIGLAFLLTPSGWLVRLAALPLPIEQPPDLLSLRDPLGLALACGLVLKETPFLFFAALAGLRQLAPTPTLHLAATLGYAPGIAWWKLVAPRLYPLMRLPVYAALAYGLSAVDMALILGPSAPPTLAVLALDLTRDPDLARRFPAAALAVLHLALVLGAVALWRGGELVLGAWQRRRRADGRRIAPAGARMICAAGSALAALAALLAVLAILALPLWSVAETWRFPAALPVCCSLAAWRRAADGLAGPLRDSIGIAACVGASALIAAIAWLKLEPRGGAGGLDPARLAHGAVALPLMISDLAFLLGVQVLLLALGLGGGWLPVAAAHFVFVFPYVLLALAGPWARLDPRFERAAFCLGASAWRVLLRVRLPLLAPSLAFAGALGVAVSLSLYLPTVLAGGGRVATLATEAIALAAGGDRRITGVYGTLQAALIWSVLLLAGLLARRRSAAVMA